MRVIIADITTNSEPVSYTHLDVYKRQLERISEYFQSLPFSLKREDFVFVTKNKTGLSIRAIQKLVMKYTDAFNVPMSPHKMCIRDRSCSHILYYVNQNLISYLK